MRCFYNNYFNDEDGYDTRKKRDWYDLINIYIYL